MTSRREVLGGLLTGAAASIAATGREVPARVPGPPAFDDVSFLQTEPLLNIERARYMMQRVGVDAIAVTLPANVFYLSNHAPSLDRMGFRHSSFVVFPLDPKRPMALVLQGFLLYYRYADEVSLPDRVIYPYNSPAADQPAAADGAEPVAAATRMHRVLDESLLTARERRRRAYVAAAEPPSAAPDWALAKAVRAMGLENKRIATDDPVIEAVLARRGVQARYAPGEDLLRQIRFAKTPAEIKLMRIASRNNVDAAMSAALAARALGSTRAVRAQFFAEAERRGNHGVFMVLDGSSSERIDEPIRDGMAFSFDCVSTFNQYHGDFSRTVFVGEPHPQMRRCTTAIHVAWQEVQAQLRAGMRFTDVQRIGRESMKKQGADFTVSFTPHSVGLFHSDHPRPSLTDGRSVEGLVLEKDMVLSVDCPVLDTGIGGTAHLEDLMLIGEHGATPIHDVPPNVLTI